MSKGTKFPFVKKTSAHLPATSFPLARSISNRIHAESGLSSSDPTDSAKTFVEIKRSTIVINQIIPAFILFSFLLLKFSEMYKFLLYLIIHLFIKKVKV